MEEKNVLDESADSHFLEIREVYPTGFRNIDTILGFHVYNEETEEIIQTNRGILSGSWITLTGVPHAGKSTLGYQMISTMMRRFINENNPDGRVKLYIFDVENGVNRTRFKQLTNMTDIQIARHVRWQRDVALDDLEKLIVNIIKERSDKNYKTDKRMNSQGKPAEMYPPAFIIVDSISEMLPRNLLDIDVDSTNTLYMKQRLKLDTIVKKYRKSFIEYNINVLTISHLAKNIDINAMPGAKPIRSYKGMSGDTKISGGKSLEYSTDIGINIEKIVAADEKAVERNGGKILDASSIMQAKLFKNRQGLDNTIFFLTYDKQGKFDILGSFIYECQQLKVIESAGVVKKIRNTDIKCRSQDLIEKILTDEEFRNALFNEYDVEMRDALECMKLTKKEIARMNNILDIFGA